jgi:hypothetical protein
MRQGIFAILFKESGIGRIGDDECASNEAFRNFIATSSIGVYRRLNLFLPVVRVAPASREKINRR